MSVWKYIRKMLLRVFHEYEFTANTPVHRRAICCFYDLEIRVYNNSVGGTFSQHRAPSKRNPLEIFIKKVHGESMSGEGGEARIHHRYTRPVINSRPMPYPLWYLSQPCTYRYTSISLSPPPLRALDFRARTHGNSCQDEGRIVRENARVVAGKILFRFPSCLATYRGKRARTEIFYSTEISIDLSLLLRTYVER